MYSPLNSKGMKKIVYLLLISSVLVGLSACKTNKDIPEEPKFIEVKSISLSSKEATLLVGNSFNLSCTILPSNASDKKVTWSSSNDQVATVNGGLVQAISGGTVVITARSSNGLTSSCKITVRRPFIAIERIELSPKELTLIEGDKALFVATVFPVNATNKDVLWKSSNPDVAKINGAEVQALSEGTATITVTSFDGGVKAEAHVTVKSPAPKPPKEGSPTLTLEMNEKDKRKKVYVSLTAPEDKRADIWIDLNGNSMRDKNEEIKNFDKKFVAYSYTGDKVTIYGDPSYISLSANYNIISVQAAGKHTAEYLDLSANGITTISLEGMEGLKHLNCSNNNLVSVAFIEQLSTLTSLVARNCKISSIKLSKLKDLRYLDLSGNDLKMLDVKNNPLLQALVLNDNKLFLVEYSDISQLRFLDISSNEFRQYWMENLYKDLPSLVGAKTPGSLWVSVNPGTNLADYSILKDKNWRIDMKNKSPFVGLTIEDYEGIIW